MEKVVPKCRNLQVCRAALHAAGSVRAVNNRMFLTAIKAGNVPVVKMLMDPELMGAEHYVHADANNNEALQKAVERGNAEMVR